MSVRDSIKCKPDPKPNTNPNLKAKPTPALKPNPDHNIVDNELTITRQFVDDLHICRWSIRQIDIKCDPSINTLLELKLAF